MRGDPFESRNSFRTSQAVADLLHHIRVAPPATLARIGPGLAEAAPDGRLPGGRDAFDRLVVAAFGDHAEAARLALALLLADRLQDGAVEGGLAAAWDRLSPKLDAAPPGLRAALAQAALRARELDLLDLEAPPEAALLTTRPRDALLAPLRALAEAMTDAERDAVSRADYGCDAAAHRAALDGVIDGQGCLMTAEQGWHPSEVVELTAHVRAQAGFVGATAVLLVNALMEGDPQGWFEFRWEGLAPDYLALPEPARGAILGGIRHLYESDATFLTLPTRAYGSGPEGWPTIPVVG